MRAVWGVEFLGGTDVRLEPSEARVRCRREDLGGLLRLSEGFCGADLQLGDKELGFTRVLRFLRDSVRMLEGVSTGGLVL